MLVLGVSLFFVLNHFFFKIDGVPSLDELFGIYKPIAEPVTADTAQVHFIDVGQGDSAVIITSEAAILIDGGEYDMNGKVYNSLKSHGVEKLDLVICSHPHSDHIGSLSSVLTYMPAEKILLPAMDSDSIPSTKTFKDLLETAEKRNIPIAFTKSGDKFSFGDNLTVDIIAPLGGKYEKENNNSVVCNISVFGKRFLFTGDVESEEQSRIVKNCDSLKCDVIKVPHHGSRTSAYFPLISKASPDYAVFTAGQGNSYGHPHDEALEMYGDFGCTILRTDLKGSVVFIVSRDTLKYITEADLKKG